MNQMYIVMADLIIDMGFSCRQSVDDVYVEFVMAKSEKEACDKVQLTDGDTFQGHKIDRIHSRAVENYQKDLEFNKVKSILENQFNDLDHHVINLIITQHDYKELDDNNLCSLYYNVLFQKQQSLKQG